MTPRTLTIPLLLLFSTCLAAAPATQPYLLHVPGIGGHLRLDDNLIRGLHDGDIPGYLEIYDWTGADRGLIALQQQQRHEAQSTSIAEMLAKKVRDNPEIHIRLTCHSAGCGIAVWALEKLPDGAVIDDLVMMQSALSPEYDLSKALRHVRRAYALYAESDSIVLGTGTRIAGTVDGIRTDAAGRVGYTMPAGADAIQYKKLQQFGYEDAWTRFNDAGDHIGPMTYAFAREMIAPLLLTGKLPKVEPLTPATTRAASE